MTDLDRTSILLSDHSVDTLEAYERAGGGSALALARERGPAWIIEEIRRSGLRGRGGAGFPTGAKWRTVSEDPCPTKFVVCNAAEGEPGAFKDRWLLRNDPYAVIEGLAVAGLAVGASGAWIGIKSGAEREIARVDRAMREMAGAGMIGDMPMELVAGPDEYLFGEEKALLEVIEGNPPLPRTVPPWMEGLFRKPDSPNPTAVNNAETLANVPHILRQSADWFRSIGTADSPGTMLLTLCGDIRYPGIFELPMGFTLRELIHGIGGGPQDGREVKVVFPGASSTIITPEQFDTPMSFEAMGAVGTGLGAGAFVVYDESACIVRAALAFSRFLYVESCAQCPACKHGTRHITELLERVDRGDGSQMDIETILARSMTVTDAQRCALPTGESLIAQSAIQVFGDEFAEHFGSGCSSPREIQLPKIVDIDEHGGFVYDDQYRFKQPDWTYADEDA
jgi:NADH:ubiquinone oxidoreductase subunit F (NADH-binding)